MSHDEPRHETKYRIADLTIFSNGDLCIAAFAGEFDMPTAAKREFLITYLAHYAVGFLLGDSLVRDTTATAIHFLPYFMSVPIGKLNHGVNIFSPD